MDEEEDYDYDSINEIKDEYSDIDDEIISMTMRTGVYNDCCMKMCISDFDDDFISKLKADLSKLSESEKRIFLFSMISIKVERLHCKKAFSNNFIYTVKEYGILRNVCKKAFIYLYDTTPTIVRTLCGKLTTNILIPTDNRGKHENNLTISEQTKDLIKVHFFNTLESPTIFKCCTKNFGQPNISKMWLDFKGKYNKMGFRVSRCTYTKYVRTLLTPDALSKFKSANEARKIYKKIYNK